MAPSNPIKEGEDTNIRVFTGYIPKEGKSLREIEWEEYGPVSYNSEKNILSFEATEEQVEKMQELHPDCVINSTVPSGLPDANGVVDNEGYCILWKSYRPPLDWRGSQAIGWYKIAYKVFGYYWGYKSYAFFWNDPKYMGSDPYVKPVNVQVWDTSFLFEDWEDPHSLEPEDPDGPPGVLLYEFEH